MEIHLTASWGVLAAVAIVLLLLSIASTLRVDNGVPLGRRVLLVGLRAVAVAVALLILLDPHETQQEKFRERTELAILVDASASMTFTDGGDGRSRWRAARQYVDRVLAPALVSDYDVRTYVFSNRLEPAGSLDQQAPDGKASELATALEAVLVEGRNVPLGGVVVVGDGQTPAGPELTKAARKFRKSGIPVFGYVVGDEREEPDIALAELHGEQPVPFEPRIRLALTIQSPGFGGQETTLSVRRGERLLFEKRIELTGELQQETVEFVSPFRGFHTYRVQLSNQEGERLPDNNARSVGIDLLDQKIHVLYMEGTPFQTHFLEDSLETDPDIEVTSLYFPQRVRDFKQAKSLPYRVDNKKRRIYNVSHPRRGYPQTLEDLLQYDVVINSDIYRQAFSQAQLDNTVALVEEYGGGFIMIGGVTAFGAGQYDETVIDKLMPVDAYGARDFEWVPFRLTVPEKAYGHPIMQIGDTPEETRKAWAQFPRLGGLNRANRPKPGALALARHSTKSNQYGQYVVFAVQQIGRGRTMAFTSDTTDDWGRDFQRRFGTPKDSTLYYRRFWNNAIRWLAADRIQRKNGELVVRSSTAHGLVGEEIEVTIPLPETAAPVQISLRCERPDGSQEDVELEHDGSAQILKGHLRLTQRGPHTLTARFQKTSEIALFSKRLVTAEEDRREFRTTRANPLRLAQLATVANATLLNDKEDDYVAQTLGALAAEYVEYKQRSAWDNLGVLGLFLIVLAAEWLLRRRSGFA